MAQKLRVVAANGAKSSVLLTGVFSGLGEHGGDYYARAKQTVYVPKTGAKLKYANDGTLVSETVQGSVDLNLTDDVAFASTRADGAIALLVGASKLASQTSYDDATVIAAGTLTSAALEVGPDRLEVVGTRLLSLSPANTSIFVRTPAVVLGATGGATKDTTGNGNNVLSVTVGGVTKTITVSAAAGLANATLLKELLTGFQARGWDLFPKLAGALTTQVQIISPTGGFTIVAGGLATVLGLNAQAYAGTALRAVHEDEVVANGSIIATKITINAANANYPVGVASGDCILVRANDAPCTRSVTYANTVFTVGFVQVT